jgi:solute carrier family 25 phosphate transporter 3
VLKEIPFGVSKFFVFTLTTRILFQTFPAAQEDIQMSLGVSLVSGMMGGLAAAIVSNPADATISEMKKANTKVSPLDAAKNLIARGGYANLMRGLPVRMLFYPLIVSMQFFVYDVVRLYLGVGADDLKVYLDVLGSALQDSGTTVGPV